ncbi:hypothetical protein [Burkholderia gladioli]|uniref:hypothetical protein n=1 Tax=Burkholderia gladioli TaxID=28095 RepID=UPI001C23EE9B|nr:hypothetical protein [Burkholderia gladioli]MBU9166622.1 hypothetical protein [Burkholderia gladioli]
MWQEIKKHGLPFQISGAFCSGKKTVGFFPTPRRTARVRTITLVIALAYLEFCNYDEDAKPERL